MKCKLGKLIFLSVFISLILFPSVGVSKIQLIVNDFDVFMIALPRWEVGENVVLKGQGKYKLISPNNVARFVRVDWLRGHRYTNEVILSISGRGLYHEETTKIDVGRRELSIYKFQSKNKKKILSISSYYCRSSDTDILVSVFVDEDWPTIKLLHRDIQKSIVCQEAKLDSSPIYPVISVPSGYVDVKSDVAKVFQEKNGSILAYTSASFSMRAIDSLKNDSAQIEQIARMEFDLKQTSFVRSPLLVNNMYIWEGYGRDNNNKKYDLLISWWKCEKLKAAFMGMYKGFGGTSTDIAKMSLLTAKCPE